MTLPATFRGWAAKLSNGEIAYETPNNPGERSSWQKLLARLREESLHIVEFVLIRGNGLVSALPPKACSGYYQAYEVRKMVFQGVESRLQGIGSVVNDHVYILWVDENGNISQDVRPLEGERIHTTLS